MKKIVTKSNGTVKKHTYINFKKSENNYNKRNLVLISEEKRNKKESAITLIALVITIIVLLILAGVSIAILTGQSGILTQAQNAKNATEQSGAKEKVELAVTGAIAQTNDGTLTIDNLKTEIENQGGKILGDSIPTTVKINDNLYRISSTGEVTQKKIGGTLETVTGKETTNTTVQDALGNQVVVPAGFKIVNPNDYVTDGIIIEDENYENTKGSQFVWIPVGDIIKEDKTTTNIKLDRYNFDNSGKTLEYSETDYTEDTQENHNSNYTNSIGIDIEGFKLKASNNHGYYIGRYEARTIIERTSSTNTLTQITENPNDYVYNYVNQPQAAILSKEMYTKTPFQSDLVNSYAWDTAVVFLQTFDTRSTASGPYSIQSSLNDRFANKGTNNEYNLTKQDIICNIYDMASNCWEMSTETYNDVNTSCTYRGGIYDGSTDHYTGHRGHCDNTYTYTDISFRPILYL